MDEKLDPLQKVEVALIRAEYQKRFQVMINTAKEMVGEGIEYRNGVVRVVVSETGAYCELIDMPEEFFAAVGEEVERRLVAPDEAVALLTRAVEAAATATPENTHRISILTLYTPRGLVDRKNCYVFDYTPHEATRSTPRIIGAFQPDVMPRFFKIRLEADFAEEALGFPGRIAFCMATAGDRHLLIRVRHSAHQVTDLGAPAGPETLH